MTVLLPLLWVGLAGWIGLSLWMVIHARNYPTVSGKMELTLQQRPRVSIIIPARNEARILAQTLPKFLDQDYEDYDVILVDDASSDDTPALAGRLAEVHARKLRVIRIEELPDGWIGKTHALHQGFQAAKGDWVLSADADMVFDPKALRAGLWLAEREQAELVSLYGFMECRTFWEKLILPGFALLLSAVFPINKINDPRSSVALASGGYILMRRDVWEALGGYGAIRSEMIDDLNTARLVKHSGHRIYVAGTKDLVRTRMYYSFRGIWEGLRKNAFAAHHFSVPRMLLTASGYVVCNLVPLLTLLFYGGMFLGTGEGPVGMERTALALSAAQYGLSIALHLPLMFYFEINLAYALLALIDGTVYAGICFDSMGRTLLGGGVSWKQRRYGKIQAHGIGEERAAVAEEAARPGGRSTEEGDTF